MILSAPGSDNDSIPRCESESVLVAAIVPPPDRPVLVEIETVE
jgi:hypothetical protein